MKTARRLFGALLVLAMLFGPNASRHVFASSPNSDTLNLPDSGGTQTLTWSGGPYTIATPDPSVCVDSSVNCDTYTLTVAGPSNYWANHDGDVKVEIDWANNSNDFDLYIYDSSGNEIDHSGASGTTSEKVDLGKLAPGTYTVQVVAYLTANATYTGTVTLNSTALPPGMIFPENKDTILHMLTVDYPLNVVFVGYKPSATEVADLKNWIPDNYQPTVAQKSPGGDEVQNTGADLLNWNKNHLTTSRPYFVGIRYNYKIHVIQASDDYAKAIFQVAKDNTAQGQDFHDSKTGDSLAKYDAAFGKYRILAKNGDSSYAVTNPTKTDLIDAYSVEDWIFNSRNDPQWSCAFTDLETNKCMSPAILDPDPNAYHDNYYDAKGLNLDHIPQGPNKGSSVFFFDTFSPSYASDYFRPSAYHTWGTDKVINGQIIAKPVEDGGSWRITDPDTHGWSGVDFARTWGGRYRFHFFDLGAAPNDYESATWASAERTMSSDYPFGDPPIWQYEADPLWQQTGDSCAADPQVTNYTGGTPCRIMPRLGRDVAYDLFFRSTAGYLYRPTPRGDVNWLAVSNWSDFYSHPQWVNGQLTNAPWYGTWWTDQSKLYKINQVGDNSDDVLRWLSAAEPYVRWIGRKGETVHLYDPSTNQPTSTVLDASPKYEDLPAPQYHVQQSATGVDIAPEPLYPSDGQHVIATYGSSQVDLTGLSNEVEKAKARGLTGSTYDDSVSDTDMRDYIDAHRAGIADQVPGVNTIPAINMVFEKAYTWALPAIVGGIAEGTADGEAWGVLNNVNDRFGACSAHYPAVQQGDAPGSKRSITDQCLPTQQTGTGFSYTIEHEAAHNLGLSHPHDGSYGVDRCPAGDPNAGKWECYWSGLGWVMDVSAAPTTYAMDYHPYEVEDQDNIQRGHVAEYLLKAQDSLRQRLVTEAQGGATTPSSTYTADFNRMATWRTEATQLFACGDYLHAEYAARNASLAAQGVPQTTANTSDPKLLWPGQVYYFNVHPQCSIPQPDLKITNLTASASRAHRITFTATVANAGNADAANVPLGFTDGSKSLGTSTAIPSIAAGKTGTATFVWDTRGLSGTHTISATADPTNTIIESDETNNTAQTSVTIPPNKVTNASFETSSTGKAPTGWSSSTGTTYDRSGSHATDGVAAAGVTATKVGVNPTWTSAPIAVNPGQSYNVAMTVANTGVSSGPRLLVQFLNSKGSATGSATVISTSLTGTTPANELQGKVVIPSGVTQVRVALVGFSASDAHKAGSTWFDDIWMW